MSVGPRVVFTRFLSSESPKLRPWMAHRGRVIDVATVRAVPTVVMTPADEGGPAEPTDTVVVWQLVSANNRQLARSAHIHTSFEAATTSARSIVESAVPLTVGLISEQGRGVYGWFASIDEAPVMICARWYATERDRRHSIQLALASIATAALHAGARLVDPALMRDSAR